MLNEVGDPAYGQAQRNTARGEPGERQNTAGERGELVLHDDGSGELKREEAAGIVDQTLSFEDVDDPAAQADAPGDRCGGNGVGRCGHGAEYKAEPPVEALENSRRDEGEGAHGKTH